MSEELSDQLSRLRVFPAPVPTYMYVKSDGFVSPVDCLIEDRPWAQKILEAQEDAADAVDLAKAALARGDRAAAAVALRVAQTAERTVFPKQDSYGPVLAALGAADDPLAGL